MSNLRNSPQPNGRRRFWRKRLLLLALLAVLAALGYWRWGDALTLANLASQETRLRQFHADHPVLLFGLAILVYVSVTGLSLPGGTFLTLSYGWYFGLAVGILLVSFTSTAGATVAFLLSRYLLREFIQERFKSQLRSFNQSLEEEGAWFLFTLRLIPAVPFFVINAVMGLTPIRTRTYWWVSQLGMLPLTAVYVYAGSRVPDLQTLADKGVQAVFSPRQLLQLFIALTVVGLVPLAIRAVVKRLPRHRARRGEPESGPSNASPAEDSTGNGLSSD